MIDKKEPLDNQNILGEIGRNLRQIRRSNGLSQKQLAMLLGVTFQQVQKYENGTNRLRLEHILFLRNHFGIGYDRIFPDGRARQTSKSDRLEHVRQKKIEKIIASLGNVNDNRMLDKVHDIIKILNT